MTVYEKLARILIANDMLNDILLAMYQAAREGDMKRAEDAATTVGVLMAWMERQKIEPIVRDFTAKARSK